MRHIATHPFFDLIQDWILLLLNTLGSGIMDAIKLLRALAINYRLDVEALINMSGKLPA